MMMKVQKKAENCEKVFDIFQCYTYCMRPVTANGRVQIRSIMLLIGIGSFYF